MENIVERLFYLDILGNIPLDEPEIRMIDQVGHIGVRACDKIIHAAYPVPLFDEAVAKMRPEKTCSSGN